MKKLVILAIVLTSCNYYDKPFIIVYKSPNSISCSDGYCSYHCVDDNGTLMKFCEDNNKYNMGDTIK